MTASARERVLHLMVLGVVVLVVGAYLQFTLRNASYTLGCDYLTYDAAARRWLSGAPLYDLSTTVTGECGLYQYPPSFIVMVLPFTLLSPEAATWAWIAMSVVMVGLAIALMPVSILVRLVTLAIAGTSWPLLFAVKVGAAGPLLLLVFAAAWRWVDRPALLGSAAAAGALAKLQPALLLPWMALTGRWRALLVSCAIGLSVLALGLLVDRQSWMDFFTTIRTLSGTALDVPANVAPASLARRWLDLSPDAARLFGIGHTVVVLALVVYSSLRSTADASLLVTAVASQVVAPVMWDHYALILFLPMAWLLARRHYWAILVGVALNAMLILWVPLIAYVVLMDLTMIAVAFIGLRPAGGRAAVTAVSSPERVAA